MSRAGDAGEICSLQLCPEDGGRILKVGPWKRWTCEIRFVLFPSRGPGWEDDPRPAGQWNGPPLITSGPARGSVVTRSIFISKSFPLSTVVSSKLGWGEGHHGLNRMITRNRIR